MRVLHAPVNVGNQPWVLSRYERALGLQSELVINYSTRFGYPADRVLGRIADRRPGQLARRLWFGLTAPWRYDVLHLYFGRSPLCWDDLGGRTPLWFQDVAIAKRLGRKVFMTLQGCDVRLSHRSAERNSITPCSIGHCGMASTCRASLDGQRQWLIREILPRMDRTFVLNPELAEFVPGAVFMPYASVDVASLEPVPPRVEGPITIVHAPTDPTIKGTKYIVEAVERLKRRHPVNLKLIEGVPHDEAMKMYRDADLVIDQVLAGWYGGLAVEVMAMAKPVACYIRHEDLGVLPERMRAELPVADVTPQTLERDLEVLIGQRQTWPEWGRRCRDYVLRWHNPSIIAQAIKYAYEDPGSRFRLTA